MPGDDVRARITKVKRGFAEGIVAEERPLQRIACRCALPALRCLRRLPLSDLAYSVQLAEKERQVRDALVRIGRFAEPPLDPIVPAASQIRVPQQARVLVHVGRGRRRSRLSPRRPLGRGHRDRGVPADDRRRQRRPACRSRWAREEQLEAYDQENGSGISAISSCGKGGTRGRRSWFS